jgi:hypothetical protein
MITTTQAVNKSDLALAADLLQGFLTHSDITEQELGIQRVIEFLDATITEMRKQNAGA